MRCLCFFLLMNKTCIIARNDNEIFWKCSLLFAQTVCKDMQNRNNHNPIAWICAINPPNKQSIKQSSNQQWQLLNQQAIKRWIQTNNYAIKQSINLSRNLVNKVDSVPQRMSQQQHQASNASMRAAPSFASSPSFPSDWSTFRVSLLKFSSSNTIFIREWDGFLQNILHMLHKYCYSVLSRVSMQSFFDSEMWAVSLIYFLFKLFASRKNITNATSVKITLPLLKKSDIVYAVFLDKSIYIFGKEF